MEYVVKGKVTLGGSKPKGFEIVVSAKSEKHARSLAMAKIGASQHTKSNRISIISISASAGKDGEKDA